VERTLQYPHDFPEVRERWFKFHNERMDVEARRWLEEQGIDPR
jgi:hypothetical protein